MKKYIFCPAIVGAFLSLVSCMTNEKLDRISVKQFGVLDDGRSVQVYTLKNSTGSSIDILDLGGIITAINVPDREGHLADIALGFDNAKQYLTDSPYMGALVGRYANRIARGKFSLDGNDYTLAINNIGNALHGGIVGFDKKIWQSTARTTDDAAMLTLTLLSSDGDEGYPGALTATVTYTFDDQNRLTIAYHATTDKATVINLTNHSYFNLNGHNAGSILDHVMMIKAGTYTPVDETLIPTGEMAPVNGTVFDFESPKPIGRDIGAGEQQIQFGLGYDHNWVLEKSAPNDFELAATVYSPKSGRMINLYTDQPGLQFYTGNFLDGTVAGKENANYQKRGAFCLETQHFPDSPNHPNFPTTVLRPGETYETTTVFEFGVIDRD
ncbi:MAG: galactose mutarotase [Kordiimonadaceae bacterium]|nr:galactose mutarotase [Kordiimonadaceae bacterium]